RGKHGFPYLQDHGSRIGDLRCVELSIFDFIRQLDSAQCYFRVPERLKPQHRITSLGSVANKPSTRCSMLVDWPNSIITEGCSEQIQSVQMATLSLRDHSSLRPLVFCFEVKPSRSQTNGAGARPGR